MLNFRRYFQEAAEVIILIAQSKSRAFQKANYSSKVNNKKKEI